VSAQLTGIPKSQHDDSGQRLPYSLPDKRPVPENLPTSHLDSEGASIYWHWRNALNLAVWD